MLVTSKKFFAFELVFDKKYDFCILFIFDDDHTMFNLFVDDQLLLLFIVELAYIFGKFFLDKIKINKFSISFMLYKNMNFKNRWWSFDRVVENVFFSNKYFWRGKLTVNSGHVVHVAKKMLFFECNIDMTSTCLFSPRNRKKCLFFLHAQNSCSMPFIKYRMLLFEWNDAIIFGFWWIKNYKFKPNKPNKINDLDNRS